MHIFCRYERPENKAEHFIDARSSTDSTRVARQNALTQLSGRAVGKKKPLVKPPAVKKKLKPEEEEGVLTRSQLNHLNLVDCSTLAIRDQDRLNIK